MNAVVESRALKSDQDQDRLQIRIGCKIGSDKIGGIFFFCWVEAGMMMMMLGIAG